MRNTIGWALIALTAGLAAPARADVDVANNFDYAKKIKNYRTVQPLGERPFGENINLYTGEVSFSATDITLVGTGPEISISRRLEKPDIHELVRNSPRGFGDWALDLVQIETLAPGGGENSLGGWKDETGGWNRCAHFGEMWNPPGGLAPKYGGFMLDEWWRGYQLRLPGGGAQELLYRDASVTTRPTSGFYPSATIQHWQIGCLPATVTGHQGDAFLVLSPDGTKYSLNHLVYSTYEAITQNQDPGGPKPVIYRLPRMLARMIATRVVDRFGNSVDYTFVGEQLRDISASDGRHVTLDWHPTQPLITAIHVMPGTADERTWTYQYVAPGTDNRLQKVILPDSSAWTFNIPAAATAELRGFKTYGCFGPNNEPPAVNTSSSPPGQVDASVTITHPAGAIGTFDLAWRRHARTDIPSACGGTDEGYETQNPYFMSLSLTKKTVTGPGLSPMVWQYAYEADHASVARNCIAPKVCQNTAFVDVTDPNGSLTRYTSSTRFDALEGELLRVDYDIVNNVAKRVETREYYAPDGVQAWLFPWGFPMGGDNQFKTGQIHPVQKTTIVQQGRTFITTTTFDPEFVQPVRVERWSSP